MTIPNPPLSSIAAPHVKRVNSDYKISTPSGGNIYLDTGLNAGLVYISGDLTVQGNTTTVNTTNLVIEDNILVLNKGAIVEQGTHSELMNNRGFYFNLYASQFSEASEVL